MDEHASSFLLITLLSFATLLIVFGMKYFSAAYRDRVRVESDDAYRRLAEQAAAAQAENAASLAAIQTDFAELKARLASVEKVLREVE